MLYDISTYRIVRQKKGDHQYIEKHSHADYFHYMYVLHGKGRVIIDEHEINVSQYDMVLAAPGVEHEIFGEKDLICLDIKFSCGSPMKELLMQCGYYIRGLTSYENKLLQDMFDEAINARPLYEHAINARLLEFLFQVLRRQKKGIEMVTYQEESKSFLPDLGSEKQSKVQPAIDYIKANLDKSFQNADLAAKMGYTEAYFSTLFKECTGYSATKYINILKVEKAKELILYTNDTITQIATQLGFESLHYFSKVFKQVTGISPSNYIDRSKINMIINVLKNSSLIPSEKEYEIQIKNIDERKMEK